MVCDNLMYSGYLLGGLCVDQDLNGSEGIKMDQNGSGSDKIC